jgi:hypothetical protein
MRHLMSAFFALVFSLHHHAGRPFDFPTTDADLYTLRHAQHLTPARDTGYAEAACRSCRLTTAFLHAR